MVQLTVPHLCIGTCIGIALRKYSFPLSLRIDLGRYNRLSAEYVLRSIKTLKCIIHTQWTYTYLIIRMNNLCKNVLIHTHITFAGIILVHTLHKTLSLHVIRLLNYHHTSYSSNIHPTHDVHTLYCLGRQQVFNFQLCPLQMSSPRGKIGLNGERNFYCHKIHFWSGSVIGVSKHSTECC